MSLESTFDFTQRMKSITCRLSGPGVFGHLTATLLAGRQEAGVSAIDLYAIESPVSWTNGFHRQERLCRSSGVVNQLRACLSRLPSFSNRTEHFVEDGLCRQPVRELFDQRA